MFKITVENAILKLYKNTYIETGGLIMKYKYLKLLCLLSIFVIFFPSCMDQQFLYDKNEEISKTTDSYNILNSNSSVDNNEYKDSTNLTGYETIWSYDSFKDVDLEISCSFKVENSKAKLVFINQNNEITNLIECSSKSDSKENITLTLPIKEGFNRIKLVGKNRAKIDLTLKIDEGTFY